MKIVLFTFLLAYSMAENYSISSLHPRFLYPQVNRKFSAKLYQELVKYEEGNIVVCPFTTESILALTAMGAENCTAIEIYDNVFLSSSPRKIRDMYREILPKFRGSYYYNLHSANKMYIQKGYSILDDFKQNATKMYDCEVENADLQHDIPGTVNKINKWVADKTGEKIQHILNEQMFTYNTSMVLVNALDFSSYWRIPFNIHATKRSRFYFNKDHFTEVDVMVNTDNYGYYECYKLNVTFLEMDYQGGDISLMIILPKEKSGLASLEAYIPELVKERRLPKKRVTVHIPKFMIESSIQLKPILQNLGIRKIFDSELSDLSGITSEKDINLFIHMIIQKVFFNVTESGTEAHGFLGSGIPLEVYPEPPKEFNADHPFIFVLNNIKSHSIIFLGRYTGK